MPLDIPDNVEIDISELGIGDALYISDIVLKDKLELASNPAIVLVSVTHAMKEEEVVSEEEEEFLDGDSVETDQDASDEKDSDSSNESES